MANIKSAKKRILQTAKKTARNRFYRTRIKNLTNAVNEAIQAKDIEKANEAVKAVNRDFHKFVSKGIWKKSTAARRVSRLTLAVNKLKVEVA
jgi:small subunit ribosomal protein S20